MKSKKGARALALAAGELRYSTGKRCKNGHLADRYTLSGACTRCLGVYREREERAFTAARRRLLEPA